MTKVKDLRDQILEPQYKGIFLYCPTCGSEYSANKGDYWNVSDEHVFTCCNEEMIAVKKAVRFEVIA